MCKDLENLSTQEECFKTSGWPISPNTTKLNVRNPVLTGIFFVNKLGVFGTPLFQFNKWLYILVVISVNRRIVLINQHLKAFLSCKI